MPAFIYFTIRDGKDDKSVIEIPFPDATLVTDLPLLVSAFGQLIDPMLNGGLAGAGFRVDVDVPSFSPLAGTLADVQEKAVFAFRTANNFLKRLGLPTFNETLFVPGTKEVDATDTDVAAFITAMEDGVNIAGAGGSGVVQPCDTRGEDIDTLSSAREAWGKARK